MKLKITLLCLLFSWQAFATDYFVSPDGDDNNSGFSIDEPFFSIQLGLDLANPGDNINVLAGTYYENLYWENSGEPDNLITLKAYQGQEVIINGNNVADNEALIYLENISHVAIQFLGFTAHDGAFQPCIYFNGTSNDIYVQGCRFFKTQCEESYGILVEGQGNGITIALNNFLELVGENAIAIAVFGTHPSESFTDVEISHNVVEDCEPAPSEAIVVNGNIDGFTISHNELTNINNIGIDMIGGEDWVNDNDEVNQARNGICHNNHLDGIHSSYGGGFGAGIYVDGGKDIVIEKNSIKNSDLGIEIGCENIGFETSNIRVWNNLVYNNDKAGIVVGGFNFPTESGKVVNSNFYHNTCYNNDVLEEGFGELWIQYAEGCRFYNNIFAHTNTSVLLNAESISAEQNNDLNFNLWHSSLADEFPYFYDGNYVEGNWEAFQTETNWEGMGQFAEPVFKDPTASDFTLNMGSMAIDQGSEAVFLEEDYLGNPRPQGLAPDQGALEHLPMVQFELEVYLEGFYDESTNLMRTDLYENDLLPNSQPFNQAPYNYPGSEMISEFPDEVVDWVLVEIRNYYDDFKPIYREAALLTKYGDVIRMDGTKVFEYFLENYSKVQVAVFHKSHLAVMASEEIYNDNFNYNGAIEIDMTDGIDAGFGEQQLKLIDGKAMLYCGDYDGSGIINSQDFNLWKSQNALVNNYVSWDGDGNGIVNSIDYNLWRIDNAKVGVEWIQF